MLSYKFTRMLNVSFFFESVTYRHKSDTKCQREK